jgi:hypothetical protein
MAIPDDLGVWSLDTVRFIVTHHEFEPGRFDFKEVLSPTRASGGDGHLASIARTACSFANTAGGLMLFGVKDPGRHRGVPPDDLIVGVPPGDLRGELGDKLQHIQPEIEFDTVPRGIELPGNAQRVVFVASILLSPRRPHMYQGVFYRRGDGGKAEPMNVYEVREQMLNTEERLRKVTLLRLEILQLLLLAEELERMKGEVFRAAERFDASALKGLIADICVVLPREGLDAHLRDLLALPLVAGEINRELDRGTTESPRPTFSGEEMEETAHGFFRVQTVDRKLTDLIRRCQEAEARLAAAFGPLGD